MAIKIPPRYRVDAKPVWIHPQDKAWRDDLIEKEVLEIRARNEARLAEAEKEGKTLDPDELESEDHPVFRWWRGEMRFDPRAVMVVNGESKSLQAYLDESKDPWRFHLRRLDFDERDEVFTLHSRDVLKGRALACAYGLVEIEGKGAPKFEGRGKLTREDMVLLSSFDSDPNPLLSLRSLIGAAVFEASGPMSEEEKKH